MRLSAIFTKSKSKIYVPSGAPVYNPTPWVLYPERHNCFTYAARLMDRGPCAPGSLNKRRVDWLDKAITVDLVREKLISDGLIETDDFSSDEEHVIAAFVKPSFDFHFYSQDQGGDWSGLDGDKVRRIMNVTDPNIDLATDKHPEFVGLFKMSKSGTKYKPVFG